MIQVKASCFSHVEILGSDMLRPSVFSNGLVAA